MKGGEEIRKFVLTVLLLLFPLGCISVPFSKEQVFKAKLSLASVYQQKNQLLQSESLLNELLKEKELSKDQLFQVKLSLANFYNANGQYTKSFKFYNELISEYKGTPRHLNELKFIKDNFFIIHSLAEYEKIREIAAINKDSTDKILAKFAQMQIGPQSSFAYNLWGNIYLEKGEYERAIEEFQKVISMEPKSLIAHTGLKDAYIRKREYIKASIELMKLEKLSGASNHPISFRPAYYNFNNIYMHFVQSNIETKEIFSTIKVMLKILPQHSDVLYAALGAICFYRGLYQESERFFRQSIACQMPNGVHRDFGYAGMGRIYLNKGLISEAISNFKLALEFNTKSTYACEGLGIIYDKYLNRRDDALLYYKKYFESGGISEKIQKRLLELEKRGG